MGSLAGLAYRGRRAACIQSAAKAGGLNGLLITRPSSLMTSSAPRVFISYSGTWRRASTSRRTYLGGLARVARPERHWWSQIEEAIAGRDNLENVVLIVSPAALASKIVEREWRLARREGKTISAVIPRKHKGSLDFASLPVLLTSKKKTRLAATWKPRPEGKGQDYDHPAKMTTREEDCHRVGCEGSARVCCPLLGLCLNDSLWLRR